MSALEDEAVSLSYWLAKQLGEHVDDQAGETLTGTVQRLMNGNPANKHEAVRSMGSNQERATIYASGYAAGMSRAMRHMSDEPHLSLEINNPYAEPNPNAGNTKPFARSIGGHPLTRLPTDARHPRLDEIKPEQGVAWHKFRKYVLTEDGWTATHIDVWDELG